MKSRPLTFIKLITNIKITFLGFNLISSRLPPPPRPFPPWHLFHHRILPAHPWKVPLAEPVRVRVSGISILSKPSQATMFIASSLNSQSPSQSSPSSHFHGYDSSQQVTHCSKFWGLQPEWFLMMLWHVTHCYYGYRDDEDCGAKEARMGVKLSSSLLQRLRRRPSSPALDRRSLPRQRLQPKRLRVCSRRMIREMSRARNGKGPGKRREG